MALGYSKFTLFQLWVCITLWVTMSFQVNPSFADSYHLDVVNTESSVRQPPTLMDKDTCGDVCTFDEWYQRAHCEERDLNYVPYCYGCEGAVMLELQNNQISQITMSSTLGYDRVRTIDLSRNDLTFIQYGTFLSMNSLKNILMSNNLLKEVANFTFMGTGGSLTRIFLNHNQIKTIHKDAFRGLLKVTSLFLSYNQIEFLHESTFCEMYALRHLYLNDNNINYLASHTLTNLSNLESIGLSKNNLRRIPKGLFNGLAALKEVTLADNQLVTIPSPKYFGVKMRLKLLDLRNNDFNTTDDVIPHLHVSHSLLIEGNPFICDCTFITIREWYLNKSNSDYQIQDDQIRCFWNESFISIIDDFPVHCDGGSRVDNFSMQSESPYKKQDNTLSVTSVTTWMSQKQAFFTTTETADTILLPLPKEYDGCVHLNNQKLDRRQRILLIYCVTILTLFFVLWVIKTCISLQRKMRKTKLKRETRLRRV